MWKIIDDQSYNGFLLSIYKYEELGHVGDDFEIRVREGNGLDESNEWLETIYTAQCESFCKAVAIGEAFVDGLEYGLQEYMRID